MSENCFPTIRERMKRTGKYRSRDAVTDGMTAALYGQFQGPLAVKRVKNMQIVSGVFEK